MTENFGFENEVEFLQMLETNKEVEFVRFITADMLGERECSFTVPKETLSKGNLEKGFDASSLYPERIKESDKLAKFDPTTARIFPVTYKTDTPGFEKKWKEVIVFGDVVDTDGKEYVYDSRSKLKNVLKDATKTTGADTIYLGPEMEFFLFQMDELGKPVIKNNQPVPLDSGTYFKLGGKGRLRKEVQLLMSEMGYKFEYDHHEAAPGQHEIDVHYNNAVDMADFMMLYRYVVKKVAKAKGIFASFMPKPLPGVNGSGMHMHQSLFKQGKNLFFDRSAEFGLSEIAYQYMAGLMKYVPEITVFLNQWENSYKRLIPGYEAPVYICWDPQNRSNLIRIPQYEPGSEKAMRLELRSPDPAANPYLASAMMIAAGLQGIKEKLPKPKPSNLNVYELNQTGRNELGIKSLPGSLEEAVNLAEKSELVKSVIGERFLTDFVKIKRKEIETHKKYLQSMLMPDEHELLKIL